jgi:hypothetical protein
MDHICDSTCACKRDLATAAAALEEASKLLAASVFSGCCDDVTESYYAFFRLAKAKFRGARAAYKDHLREMVSATS